MASEKKIELISKGELVAFRNQARERIAINFDCVPVFDEPLLHTAGDDAIENLKNEIVEKQAKFYAENMFIYSICEMALLYLESLEDENNGNCEKV